MASGTVVVGLSGGLGNQLFQFAAGFSVAMQHDRKLLVDTRYLSKIGLSLGGTRRDYGLGQFNLPLTVAGDGDLLPFYALSAAKRLGMSPIAAQMERHWVAHIREQNYQYQDPTSLLRKHSYLNGLWHSYKYFQAVEESLREVLTPVSAFPKALRDFRQMVGDSGAICVHVRRGDYSLTQGPARLLELRYYFDGIATLTRQIGSQKVYIFSDDPDWCSRQFLSAKFKYEIVGHGLENPDFSHFYLMSGFRNFVISNSTFAWWAVWLAGDNALNVVAPENWFNAAPDIDTSGFIPSSWQRIKNKILR